MFERFDPDLKAQLSIDERERVRQILHSEHWVPSAANPRAAAIEYVRAVAHLLGIPENQLTLLQEPVSYFEPAERGTEFHFSEERLLPGSATEGFYQTNLNVPVWGSGVTVTLKPDPLSVISAVNTSRQDVRATLPPLEAIKRFRALFRTAAVERADEAFEPGERKASETADFIRSLVAGRTPAGQEEGMSASASVPDIRLIRGRFFVYRYDPPQRFLGGTPLQTHAQATEPAGEAGGRQGGETLTLPLPPVDSRVEAHQDRLVAEITFSYPTPRFGDINWLALVDVQTSSVLYLRALAADVGGRVFLADPISESGVASNGPDQTNAVLNPFKDPVTLPNLNAPVVGTQSLKGLRVTVSDIVVKTVAPPTKSTGLEFDYPVRTDDFAAVNSYYHTDRFFALVEDLGFPVATYFNQTTFPLPVDHRGSGLPYWGPDEVNAHCVGNGVGGVGHCCYALAHVGDLVNPIGIAADWRVHLHELAGHGILYEWVNSANFGFSHSAGDSFAAILNDPDSKAPDRFQTFPWMYYKIARRHDRTPAGGYGWSGSIALSPFDLVLDKGGYNNEQILSSTMFRIYRSIGGDSSNVSRRRFAARMTAHLLLQAIATLTQPTNPTKADDFAKALIAADKLDWPGAGLFGGAYGKVIRWSFEKQGLYQAPGTPTPNNSPGQPPSVDVYVDDGRAGEYGYQPVHWNTTTIWNRHNADGIDIYQAPLPGVPNYAYVKIKNRGTQPANDVVVRGYHCKPSAGLLWPDDFDALTTTSISVGTVAANNVEEKVVGPFTWTPVLNAYGHDCLLMIVSATGDASNVDNFAAGESIPEWRLVPNDNNIGQRNVIPAPGGGGIRGLMVGLDGYRLWVGNPNPLGPAIIQLEATLPALLSERGWQLSFPGVPAGGFELRYGKQKEVILKLKPGRSFKSKDIEEAIDQNIVVSAYADGGLIGGMTYRLDPKIVRPLNGRRDQTKGATRWPRATRRLLGFLSLRRRANRRGLPS